MIQGPMSTGYGVRREEEEARESCQGQIHHRGRGEAKGKEHGEEKWADIQGETPLSPRTVPKDKAAAPKKTVTRLNPVLVDSVSTSSLEKEGSIPP